VCIRFYLRSEKDLNALIWSIQDRHPESMPYSADLKAHRGDTGAHHGVYRVREVEECVGELAQLMFVSLELSREVGGGGIPR
jgi:hypothetical protein